LGAEGGGSAKLGGFGLLLLAIVTVGYVRPKLVAGTRAVKLASDVFALPPPSILTRASLGYRAALADLLYTSTVVSYGIHGEERRRFEFVGQYLDSIVALDPTFCQTYRYADTFLIYQPVGSPGPDEVRHARRLLEQGLTMCPSDGRLWLSAGQFMVFIGTQFLTDDAEKAAFRAAGAKMLARAADLVTDNHNVQWQALAAAGIFTREGNREAAIAFLERVYHITDDAELKANVSGRLSALRQEGALEQAKRHAEAFNETWRRDLPFVSRTGLLVIGPPFDATLCGGASDERRECAASWAEWTARQPMP
jgi:tetratricopeptide (TPR) repeat protein